MWQILWSEQFMDDTFKKLAMLKIYAKHAAPFELRVSGNSMFPILKDGTTITVYRKESYQVGDILVFLYKNETVIVHRLLKIQNERYFCKGDNSFRIEDISFDQIIGAIKLDNDNNKTDEFIVASLQIGKMFRNCGYITEKVQKKTEYIEYAKKYLENNHEISKK